MYRHVNGVIKRKQTIIVIIIVIATITIGFCHFCIRYSLSQLDPVSSNANEIERELAPEILMNIMGLVIKAN